MHGHGVNRDAEPNVAPEPRAGRWQFSLLQLGGVSVGLALLLGSAAVLARPSSMVRAMGYGTLATFGGGTLVGSIIRRPLGAMVAAFSAALTAIVPYFLLSVAALDMGLASAREPHIVLLVAVLFMAVPGAMAARRGRVQYVHTWGAIGTVILLLGFAIGIVRNTPVATQGNIVALVIGWLLILVVLGFAGYTCAVCLAVLADAMGRLGLATLDFVAAALAKRRSAKRRTSG